MDPLKQLLDLAAGPDVPAGKERVQSLAEHVRNLDDSLDGVEDAAVTEFEKLYNSGEYDPDHTTRLEALADVTDAIRAVRSEQARAKEERDEKVSRLADRVRPADPPEDGDTDATSDNEPGNTDDSAEQTEPVAGESSEGTEPSDTSNSVTEPETQPAGVPADTTSGDVQVAASASTTTRRASNTAAAVQNNRKRNVPAPHDVTTPLRSFSITASAEVPDMPYGKKLSMTELADAALSRYATFPSGQPTQGPMQANVARINRHYADSITLKGGESDVATIDELANEKRLPGGSLVAAATKALTAATTVIDNDIWCSPSETDYTLCPSLATTSGLLDLPSTGMPRRGGIRYPVWQQYPDQPEEWRGQVINYDDGLDDPNYFHSPDGAGYPKKCISGPCVEWREVRQSLAYLCVTSDILRDRTFPELTTRFIDDVLVHHSHYLNETYISHIVGASDPIPSFSVQNGAGQIGSTSDTVADRLSLLVTWFRNTYKMAEGATLEIVAPSWFRDFLKRDLERKQNRPFGAVSDGEIAALFAQYASRVQWVYDWQEVPDGTPVGPDGAKRLMPPDSWPGNVKLLAYPAGSWLLAESNILTLGVQYDYQLLQENRYSAMFTEDAWLLLNRCNRSFVVELTDLCANGAVGPQRDACAVSGGGGAVGATVGEQV